ncbi:response regulator transcription factor [Enemella evansiae]|uniref:response regulator transcription factor n=1 Tax=Enemella evansiae TaxID=2016499 RepID=UPI000B97AE4B|nr:response regulator transcription factor [Enemella evansiae]OYN97626.1 DNA-binding response regulator [Enemella evansiae]OYO00111.1 DNA-binding response regulator [Enemella evansiae]OYO09176.1 DNA-binding response regulator [Enemella evansiae]TDO85395.1 LuxR family two component transcriptional regulator [Enemella evansiae]
MSQRLRVLIADDHALFREGLRALLETAGVEVVAEAADGSQALALARDTRPDIALVDVQMPGPGIGPLVDALRDQVPATRIAVLTMHTADDLADDLERRGVLGWFGKSLGHRPLVAGLLAVAEGTPVRMNPRSVDPIRARTAGLTPREAQVLRLVARGLSNKEVADQLYLSEATVKRHLSTLYRKLGASNRVDALSRAIATGIIDRLG